MRPCLGDEELFARIDGAVAPNDAAVLDRHVSGCARCARRNESLSSIAAHVAADEPINARAHADQVMALIDAAPVAAAPHAGRRGSGWRRALPAVLTGLALAAAVLIGVGLRRSEGEFTARGGPEATSIRRSVGVTVRAAPAAPGEEPHVLRAGESVTPKTRYLAAYRNIAKEPAYVLVFAVDARGEVHWLYPAYETEGTDPVSPSLAPTGNGEMLMPTGVTFDDVAPGRMTIFTMLTREPLRVSQIEGRRDRGVERLRQQFPGAEIDAIDVVVASGR